MVFAYLAALLPFLPFKQTPITTSSVLSPYTTEWIHALEQLYNVFPHSSNSTKSDACLFDIPQFNCTSFYWDDGIAKRDVRHLRPQDIKAVISIGDSISAGFGMQTARPPFGTVWEYRGKVFSSGSDPDEYTIANFLSSYTDTKGGPAGITMPLARGKGLNGAISGGVVQTLDEEVTRLVHQLSHKEYTDIRDDWKLITVLIGANNLCGLCAAPSTGLPDQATADAFEHHLRLALERLRIEIGHTFVNLMAMFSVSVVYDAARGEQYCEFLMDKSNMYICPCAQGTDEDRRGIYLFAKCVKPLERHSSNHFVLYSGR
ncbi:hypothetical protein INT44_004594 [Umbelopsis vinacea]|uniref:Uncharacterized protein n=1 Tax=Umbelopsis vinacea TaxID=44442 RepID=A0A8H7QB81_9FUNG|nr:hypothetical protein INT44_004594 [Umbelopsis vinacea]